MVCTGQVGFYFVRGTPPILVLGPFQGSSQTTIFSSYRVCACVCVCCARVLNLFSGLIPRQDCMLADPQREGRVRWCLGKARDSPSQGMTSSSSGFGRAVLNLLYLQDVHAFPGHIACDSASNSEIVVPIISPTTNVHCNTLNSVSSCYIALLTLPFFL